MSIERKNGRQERLVRTRLAVCLAVLSLGYLANAKAIYRDCFEIIDYGGIKHVACTVDGLTDIHYAVDKYETNDWEVIWHGGGTESRLVKAQPGEHLLTDNVFTNNLQGISGSAYPFVFEFYHWYKNGSSGRTWYGYVSLGLDSNADLAILDSAITDTQGALTVTGSPEPSDPLQSLSLNTIDHGDWLELATQCVKKDTEGWIAIPSSIDGKPIRAIGRYAFVNCSGITQITIPDSVESIGDGAFTSCTSLKAITIPNSVTNVGKYIVLGCSAIGEIHIGAGLQSIGRTAFVESGVTNVVMSIGTTNIAEYAFASSPNLKAVTIPESVQTIESLAFHGTQIAAVGIPYTTEVGADAFPANCTIARIGPELRLPRIPFGGGYYAQIDEETKIALMRTMNWRDYTGKGSLEFMGDYTASASEPDYAAYVCAHLGISPSYTNVQENGETYNMEVMYRMPSVKVVGIDPATRTITGQVIPADGSRVVFTPLRRAFGFYTLNEDQDTHALILGEDYSRSILKEEEGFSLNTTDYVQSNGLFTITFPESVETDKGTSNHFFRIRLQDNDAWLW